MLRLLPLVALLLLPACSQEPPATAAPSASSATTAPALTPTRNPGASTSASPPPSASPSEQPDPSPAPRNVPAAQGDVDGDGEADEITYEGRVALVRLSGSGETVRASTDADIDGEDPVTSGVEDLDRDGRAEVFVQVGQGASTGFLLVLRYDGRTLAPLTVDGRPRLLAFGGSATHGDGFTCGEDGSLVVRSATSEDGQAYALDSVTYRVRGAALVETARSAATGQGMADPAVSAAYVVDCRSVGEGG